MRADGPGPREGCADGCIFELQIWASALAPVAADEWSAWTVPVRRISKPSWQTPHFTQAVAMVVAMKVTVAVAATVVDR